MRVSSFDLILCVDYLLKLADFFKLPEDTEAANTIKKPELKSPTTPVATNIGKTDIKITVSGSNNYICILLIIYSINDHAETNDERNLRPE